MGSLLATDVGSQNYYGLDQLGGHFNSDDTGHLYEFPVSAKDNDSIVLLTLVGPHGIAIMRIGFFILWWKGENNVKKIIVTNRLVSYFIFFSFIQFYFSN